MGGVQDWDRNAQAWASFIASGDVARRLVQGPALHRLAGDVAGRRVLDAGCGEGWLARELAIRGAEVTAFDASEAMIDAARRLGGGVTDYRVCACEDFRLAPGEPRYPLVVCAMVLQTLPRPAPALSALRAACTDDGRLLVVVPHACFQMPDDDDYLREHAFRWRFFDGQRRATPYHHRPLSAYVEAIVAAGFVLVGLHEPKPVRPRRPSSAEREALAMLAKLPHVVIFEARPA